MRKLLPLLFCGTTVWAVSPVVVPSTPIVNQSGTINFTESASEAGTWSCAGTGPTGGATSCLGSINASGVYTAPTFVMPQHSWGGNQIAPNNAIYNTRIDSAPVDNRSAGWVSGLAGVSSPNFQADFPANLVNGQCTDSMHFTYTASNNGTFELPCFPRAKAENGWFSSLENLFDDHHIPMLDTTTGNFSDMYQYHPTCIVSSGSASVSGNVATLTCTQNPISNEFLVGSSVIVSGFTGADTYFNVTSTQIVSVTATSISYNLNHANASATTGGAAGKDTNSDGFRNSQSGVLYGSMTYVLPNGAATDAAGLYLQTLILGYQEFVRADTTPGGAINHAFRNTFSSGFEGNVSTWPAVSVAAGGGTIPYGARWRLKAGYNISGFSPKAQILLNALKQYGSFNADIGSNIPMDAEQTRWSKPYYDALTEITNANIAISSIEFVDESGYMVNSNTSLSTNNREIVTFTRTSDSAKASVDVALQGPAVNFADDAYNIMAGAPAVQLRVLNNFGGFSCAAVSTGSITSGCVYTPPASATAVTSMTVTATSLINSSMTATTFITIFPNRGIRVIPSQTSDYTDSQLNLWTARSGITNSPDNQGCCSCDSSGHFSGTDATLFNCWVGGSSLAAKDTHMDFYVPIPSSQTITYNYGTTHTIGGQHVKFSVGTNEVQYNTDPSAVGGGQYTHFVTTTVYVAANPLQIGIWTMDDAGAPVSSLSITPYPSLTLVDAGTGINESITVTSSNTFQLVFEAADNWGLSGWYDLVGDSGAVMNLANANSVNNTPCTRENGLANFTYYNKDDNKQDMYEANCTYPNNLRSMKIIYNDPSMVVLESSGTPISATTSDTGTINTTRYYILPNGKIYVHEKLTALRTIDLTAGGTATDFPLEMEFNSPASTGGVTPDFYHAGWVRASATQNPYNYVGSAEPWVYIYWDSATPVYSTFTKANAMAVLNPNNTPADLTAGQIQHSWGCGTGCGTMRWGWEANSGASDLTISPNQSISFDWLIQLGTQNSSVLPNLTSSAIAGPIANAYIANPAVPTIPAAAPASVNACTITGGFTMQSGTIP